MLETKFVSSNDKLFWSTTEDRPKNTAITMTIATKPASWPKALYVRSFSSAALCRQP